MPFCIGKPTNVLVLVNTQILIILIITVYSSCFFFTKQSRIDYSINIILKGREHINADIVVGTSLTSRTSISNK